MNSGQDFKVLNKPTNYYKVIKKYLDEINDVIKLIEDYGYSTKELYITFDMLRYELLTKDNIEKNYTEDEILSIIKELDIFCSLLSNLKIELYKNTGLIFNTSARKVKTNKTPKYEKLYMPNTTKKTITSLAITAFMIGNIFASKYAFNKGADAREVTTYSVDTFGTLDRSKEFSHDYDYSKKLVIVDYSEEGPTGLRVKREYEFDNYGDLINLDTRELLKRDFSQLEPSSVELVYDKEINEKTNETYRRIEVRGVNKGKVGKDYRSGIESALITFSMNILLFSLVSIAICTLDEEYEEGFKYLRENSGIIYRNLISLLKYKIELQKELKEAKLVEKEIIAYRKMIATLCNRVDNLVVEVTNRISNAENLKTYNSATLQKQMFEEKQKEEKRQKDEAIKGMQSTINKLLEQMTYYSSLDGVESERLLHSIPIKENVLFEEVDDHYKIRESFLPILKFLDLSSISFKNVDLRYVDLSDSNGVVNPRTIYNMDASHSKFSDRNIPDFTDYSGVNLSGTRLEEDSTTMINLDEAIIDDDTIIEKVSKGSK